MKPIFGIKQRRKLDEDQEFLKERTYPDIVQRILVFRHKLYGLGHARSPRRFHIRGVRTKRCAKGFDGCLTPPWWLPLRIVLGILTDRFGGKKTGLAGQIATMIPLILGWRFANSMAQIYTIGLLLGVAGASFAVALPLASRWYPSHHQGLAMGIAGAGNSGTVLAAFFAPRIAKAVGWHNVFVLALIPMILMFLIFLILAKDSPTHPEPKKLGDYFKPIKTRDAWLFNFFYSITFGGFVGLASFLPIFFHDQYGRSKVMAGNLTALCVFAGSFVRPIGGYLADRFGGVKVLSGVYMLVGILAFSIGT